MLAMQYSHRLPADYDLQVIRDRAARRGPLWDATEGLVLKAFVTRERGRHGATGHEYASVYLWQDSEAAVRCLVDDRFQAVIDAFGRPRIETWLPVHTVAGPAAQAASLYRESFELDASLDRPAWLESEHAHGRQLAERADTVAAWTVLDVDAWRAVRFTLSSAPPDAARAPRVYDVLHLARPGLARFA